VCDALISPVVTGHPDLAIVDTMIGLVLAFLDETEDAGGQGAGACEVPTEDTGAEGPGGPGAPDGAATSTTSSATPGSTPAGHVSDRTRALSPEALSPQARQALRYAIARLAVDLVAGPGRLASILRQGLLDAPYNSKPVILDVGYSASIPGYIRRAVQLRARHCEWPGCRKPPAHCDIHHLRHLADGGKTSISNCVLLCQFHHDICIHRWNWRLVLHPDGTTTVYGPRGQVVHSHGPPGGSGPPGTQAA
jgi:hypothetical protein